MQMKRKNNFICFVLAIAMLISGMCFDSAKVDSLLSYNDCSNATSTIYSSDNMWSHPEVRTEEISGSRILANSVKSENRSDEELNARPDFHLGSVEIFSQNIIYFFTTVSDDSHNEIRSNTVIVDYIHQKDGKKA